MRLFLVLFIFPFFLFSQDNIEWVKTEGEITEISSFRAGRTLRWLAHVKYKVENGDVLEGSVEIVRLPIIGGLQSVGDVITLSYAKNNPAILKTVEGLFIFKYGMYFLIAAGIVLSFNAMRRKKPKGTVDSDNEPGLNS